MDFSGNIITPVTQITAEIEVSPVVLEGSVIVSPVTIETSVVIPLSFAVNLTQVTEEIQVTVEHTRGESAYEIAVRNGFIGTELEWEDSLRGQDGLDGFYYTHTQAVPSAIWVVNHNLTKRPNTEILSIGGVKISGEVIHTSTNQLYIYFDSAIPGSVTCS